MADTDETNGGSNDESPIEGDGIGPNDDEIDEDADNDDDGEDEFDNNDKDLDEED